MDDVSPSPCTPCIHPAGSADKIALLRQRAAEQLRLPDTMRLSIFNDADSLHRIDQRFDDEPPLGF